MKLKEIKIYKEKKDDFCNFRKLYVLKFLFSKYTCKMYK